MTDQPSSTRCAAFFDLDKTILATSSSFALQGSFVDAGLISRRAALMSVIVHLPYLIQGADEERMDQMARVIGDLARGMDAHAVERIVEDSLGAVIDPVCYVQALEQIASHRAQGHPIVIASASVEQIVRPIAQMLGADHVLATSAGIDENGAYTGEILHYNQAHGKAEACARLAAQQGWDLAECWAYSDSVSDEPLLASVGHPVAVNPDRGLRDIAVERGWQIMHFTTRARVRRRVPQLPLPVAAAGVGIAVGVGVGAWALLASRRAA